MTAVAASSTAMTAVGKVQQAMDKIWAQPNSAVAKVCASSTAITALVAIQSTISGFGYIAVNSDLDYGTWNGKKLFIQNGKRIVCNYSGSVKSATFPGGTYKLEVYGAEGGHGTWSYVAKSGKGGYSYGNKTITAATTWYIYVGGKGADGVAAGVNGGWNGGGGVTNSTAGSSFSGWNGGWTYNGCGGGATDISTVGGECTLNTTTFRYERTAASLNGRIIVAGGAGGVDSYSSSNWTGGAGGGTTGGTGTGWGSLGAGGTQSGAGSSWACPYSIRHGGGAGNGTSVSIGHQNHDMEAPGGGGWYGGGAGTAGGGGSGYIGGVTNGGTSNGQRSGNGLAYITRIS